VGSSLGTKTLWDGEGVCPDGLATCDVADDNGVVPRGGGDEYDIHSRGGSEEAAGSAGPR
jgi:hypothetical protein